MDLVIELDRDRDVARVANELSLPAEAGDQLTVIQTPRHRWQRTKVTSWTADKVTTSLGTYSFAHLDRVSVKRWRRAAVHG